MHLCCVCRLDSVVDEIVCHGVVSACVMVLCLRVSWCCVCVCQGDEDLYLSAKEVFLRAAKSSGWSVAWLGAGKAALLVGDLSQAEAALSEANTLYVVLQCGGCCRVARAAACRVRV